MWIVLMIVVGLALAMLALGMLGAPSFSNTARRVEQPKPDRHRKLHWLRVSAAKQQQNHRKRLRRSRRFIPGKVHLA